MKSGQGTDKGCPYNGTNAHHRLIRTIVGASLVGALGGAGGAYFTGILYGCPARSSFCREKQSNHYPFRS